MNAWKSLWQHGSRSIWKLAFLLLMDWGLAILCADK